ncbi:MAG: glycerol-3-phosphate acyltransferase [candidate division WOR-3 bacterium]
MNALLSVALTAGGFLSGSLMFSSWLARLRGRDLKMTGDGNPGAVNAFKAAGPLVGGVALLLDFLKGALPVAAACWLLHLQGWALAPVIVAPVLGHAFPPWLSFRGGKALTVSFGVWSGVTLWEAPCLLGGLLLLSRLVFRLRDSLCVAVALFGLVLFVTVRFRDPALVAAALGTALVVLFKHRRELVSR